MITPKRLTIRGQMRWLAGVLVAFFVVATAVLGYFGVVGDPGSKSPDLDRGGFQIAAAVTGALALALALLMRRTLLTAVMVREDGLQFEMGPDGDGRLVTWGEIDRLRLRRIRGEIELLDRTGEKLGVLPCHLEELGPLLSMLLLRTRVLGDSPPLPASFRRERKVGERIAIGLALLFVAVVSYLAWQQNGGLFGVVFLPIFALAFAADFFLTIRRLDVDRQGITTLKGFRQSVMPWESIEGVALVPVQRQKGQVTIEAAVRLSSGKWQMLQLWGQDPLPILAAIRAAAPAKLIEGPDRLVQSGTAVSSGLVEAKSGVRGFFQQLR